MTRRLHEALPRRRARLQMCSAGAAQTVELGAPIVLREPPLRLHPSLALEAVQGGVERPFLDEERGAGGLLDPLGHGVAVLRAPAQRLQDEEIECAAHQADVQVAHRMLRSGYWTPS